jgi:hypothetical protein
MYHDQSPEHEHEAVTRLFELARSGETDNCEYSQLDAMIYTRLEQAYGGEQPPVLPTSGIQVQMAR